MAVCDANYIRILKLIPEYTLGACRELALPPVGVTGAGNSAHLVSLEVVEQFRYTSTVCIRLHTCAHSDNAYYRPPVIHLRLYHDASTAEVVSYQEQKPLQSTYHLLPESLRYVPDEKQQVNAFLAEWLMLCLEYGLARQPDAEPDPGHTELLPLA